MNDVESFEVQISSIHNIEGTWFDNEQVQDIDVVYSSFGNVDELRDIAAQVQQGMQLDCSLGKEAGLSQVVLGQNRRKYANPDSSLASARVLRDTLLRMPMWYRL